MRILRASYFLVGIVLAPFGSAADADSGHGDRLEQTHFTALPLGAIRPRGWLRDQLVVQAEGLSGHLDEFWPTLVESAWRGGSGEEWVRGPDYLNGLAPLAYLLDDPRLIRKVESWVEPVLASAQPDGWFGPPNRRTHYARAIVLKALVQYHEATGDARVIPLVRNYFAYLLKHPPDWSPDTSLEGVRLMEGAVAALWLHDKTGDPVALLAARLLRDRGYDWTPIYADWPYREKTVVVPGVKPDPQSHVVNIALALKYPALRWRMTGEARQKQAIDRAIESLDRWHGQAGGRYAADEHLAGRRPTQGTELCGVVEYMASLEYLLECFGDPAYGDRLELLALNGNPGACTPDYWAHQYEQQANQVLVTSATRAWTTNRGDANLYGLEPNFPCCTANMHQGWPKYVSHLWMASPDGGLVAVAYGPCEVKARAAEGIEVSIIEETDYPFDGTIRFRLNTNGAAVLPLRLRIPPWADGATVRVGGESIAARPGTFARVERAWKAGDVVTLELPLRPRIETRYNDAATVLRGPLVFALRIGERWERMTVHDARFPAAVDWQIYPTTPWNYGLIVDRASPENSLAVERRPVGRLPFAQETAPVVLRAKGRRLAGWQLDRNSAGETPRSPAISSEPIVDLELIPYGCTRLRITEFPVVR